LNRRRALSVFAALAAGLFARCTWPAERPTIGYLSSASQAGEADIRTAWQHGLAELGFAEGRNLQVEYRWANGRYERLADLATELARKNVSVLYVAGGTAAVLAAKSATQTIPIVFVVGGDPVKAGIVKALSQPGGNATGVNLLSGSLVVKRLEVIRQLAPRAKIFGFLYNPKNPNADAELEQMRNSALAGDIEIRPFHVTTNNEMDSVFAQLSRHRVDALIVGTDSFLNASVERIVELVDRSGLPAVYGYRRFAAAGGLVAYGTSLTDANRLAAIYVAKILKGSKPGEMPVQQATTVELVLNLTTAKKLKLSIPHSLLQRADEVIQ
jgi:putative ABC transport system substrate-binding protein